MNENSTGGFYMNKSKRRIALLAMTALMMLSLAACGAAARSPEARLEYSFDGSASYRLARIFSYASSLGYYILEFHDCSPFSPSRCL